MNPDPLSRRGFIQDFSIASGLLFLMMPVWCFILPCLTFMVGVSLNEFHFPIAVLLNVVSAGIFMSRTAGKKFVYPFLGALGLFALISVWGMIHLNRIYDTSYDGIWYQQEAVIAMKNGWNPYHGLMQDDRTGAQLFINHYPKSSWTAEGVVYAFTGKLETAKVVNLWMAIGLLFSSLFVLLGFNHIRIWVAVMLSVIIGANPVSVYQLYSFYVDGQLGAGIMSMIVFGAAIVIYGDRRFSLPLIMVFVYTANIKFTGLVYSAIILLFILGYLFFKGKSVWRFVFITACAGSIMAVMVCGYPTYVTNTWHNQHPFYPLMGPQSMGDKIASVPRPADFEGINRFHKFWKATFAQPVWSRAPLESKPKTLFRGVYNIGYLSRTDPEMSGMGPYYAEVFLLILLGILAIIVWKIPYRKEFFFFLAMLMASSFVNGEAWYARYAPQLWLVGVAVALMLYAHPKLKYGAIVLTLALMANLVVLGIFYNRINISKSLQLMKELEALKKLPYPPGIIPGWQVTFQVKADEIGLKYRDATSKEDAEEFTPFNGFSRGDWAMYKTSEMKEAKSLR